MRKKSVLILAPNHRAWGNRVVREMEVLSTYGFNVTAFMRTQPKVKTNSVEVLNVLRPGGRLHRLLSLPYLAFKALLYGADVYHLHNPDMVVVAFILKMFGKKVIYDTHEDYSKRLLLRSWIPDLLKKPLTMIVTRSEKLLSYIADATFVTQENQVKQFGRKAYLLRNAPYLTDELLTKIEELRVSIMNEHDVFRLVYIGGLSRHRGLFTMLDALEILNRNFLVRLWLAGPDLEGCLEEAKCHPAWQFVDYLDVLRHENALAYISRADLGLAVLSDVGDHKAARPSKLFEYMAMGCPFVASDFRLWREFIEPYQAGWWIEPDDAKILTDTIIEASISLDELKSRGNQGKEFISEFNWKNESRILLDVYNKILNTD